MRLRLAAELIHERGLLALLVSALLAWLPPLVLWGPYAAFGLDLHGARPSLRRTLGEALRKAPWFLIQAPTLVFLGFVPLVVRSFRMTGGASFDGSSAAILFYAAVALFFFQRLGAVASLVVFTDAPGRLTIAIMILRTNRLWLVGAGLVADALFVAALIGGQPGRSLVISLGGPSAADALAVVTALLGAYLVSFVDALAAAVCVRVRLAGVAREASPKLDA